MEDMTTALEFARNAHRNQTRKYTGLPYVGHVIAVSETVASHGGDHNQIIAALLHDTVEDTDVTLEGTNFCRRRPSDASWPSQSAWKQLNDAVGGNLIPVDFPLSALKTDPNGAAAKFLLENIRNPFYIGDQPGLTQTLGWVDAWATKPSVYAVAARNAHDIAAAVNFARENDLRLVVKGGAHSYQGTSNAPDSLLIWTRHMHDIELHD